MGDAGGDAKRCLGSGSDGPAELAEKQGRLGGLGLGSGEGWLNDCLPGLQAAEGNVSSAGC